MGILSLLPIRAWASIGAVLALSVFAWWGYHTIDHRGYARCDGEYQSAAAKAASDAHTEYLAAISWGNQISAKLAETQRRLDAEKSEYLTYANSITGVCDPSFSLFVEHASGAKTGVPAATGSAADGPSSEKAIELAYQAAMARLVAVNIAENYARLDQCVTGFSALIEWHKHKAAVNVR